MAVLPDLITPERAMTALRNMSVTDAASIPTWIQAASAVVRRYLGRVLTRAVYDELYHGVESSRIILRKYPVNDITAVRGNPVPVLTILNTQTSINQVAQARLTYTGDEATGETITGLTLYRVASGVETYDTANSPILFGTGAGQCPTIQSVAAAVNTFSAYGWSAQATSGEQLWPAVDLRSTRGGQNALAVQGAVFQCHLNFLSGYNFDRETGSVDINTTWGVDAPWLWPDVSPEITWDSRVYRMGVDAYRIVYDAGYNTPTSMNPAWQTDELEPDIQDAVALAVQACQARAKTNPLYRSRSLADYSYSLDTQASKIWLPEASVAILSYYRDRHASEY